MFVCEKVINLHDKCAMQIKGKNEKMKLPTRTVMCTDMMLINAPLILWKAIIMAGDNNIVIKFSQIEATNCNTNYHSIRFDSIQ